MRRALSVLADVCGRGSRLYSECIRRTHTVSLGLVLAAVVVFGVALLASPPAQCEWEGTNYDEGYCIEDLGCGFWTIYRACKPNGSWSACYVECWLAREEI